MKLQGLPVKHHPLRDCNNALLRLVEGGELCFDSIFSVRHVCHSIDTELLLREGDLEQAT